MIDISANELKTKGVMAIQLALEQQSEVIISVGRYVKESAEQHLARLDSMAGIATMTTYDGTTNLQTAIAALCGCSIKSQATIAKLIKQAKDSLGIIEKRRLSPQNNLAVYQWHYDRLNPKNVPHLNGVNTLPPVEINQQRETVANNTVEPIEAPPITDEHAPIEQVETIAAAIVETFAVCEPIERANNESVEIMQRLPDNAMFKFAFYTHTYGVKNRQVIGLHGCYVNALLLATGIDKKGIPAWIQSAVDSWGAFDDKLPITLQVKTLILRELEKAYK